MPLAITKIHVLLTTPTALHALSPWGYTMQSETKEAPAVHTIPESAKKARIGESSLWRHIRAGKIKTIKIGGRTFIADAELNRVITSGTDSPSAA